MYKLGKPLVTEAAIKWLPEKGDSCVVFDDVHDGNSLKVSLILFVVVGCSPKDGKGERSKWW